MRGIRRCRNKYIRNMKAQKPATAPALHSAPLHKWREADTQEETAEERDGETKSQKNRPPRHIQHKTLSPQQTWEEIDLKKFV